MLCSMRFPIGPKMPSASANPTISRSWLSISGTHRPPRLDEMDTFVLCFFVVTAKRLPKTCAGLPVIGLRGPRMERLRSACEVHWLPSMTDPRVLPSHLQVLVVPAEAAIRATTEGKFYGLMVCIGHRDGPPDP